MSRRVWPLLGLLLAVVLGAGLGWSGRALLTDPVVAQGSSTYTLVTVAEDSVSRSFSLAAAAQWSGGSSYSGGAAGMVTSVEVRKARTVRAGDRLYAVDLAPVVVAEGAVPSFRELRIGVKGADVSQLQRLLRAVKLRTTRPTGVYDVATANQVYAWKKSLGITPDGVVEQGRVIFVPALPARIALDPAVRVGAAAPVGATAVTVLPQEPRFTITLPTGQAGLTAVGQAVTLALGEKPWAASVGELAPPGDDGSVLATLAPAEGQESICGGECALVPIGGTSGIPASVVVVPKVSGPTIPTAALRVAADSGTAVVDETGVTIPVTVKASAGGLAVVEGIRPGVKIRVPQATG